MFNSMLNVENETSNVHELWKRLSYTLFFEMERDQMKDKINAGYIKLKVKLNNQTVLNC